MTNNLSNFVNDSNVLKEKLRVLGIDDGPFDRDKDQQTPLVGVLMRLDFYIEGIMVRDLTIDDLDSTDKVISMIKTRFYDQIDYVLTSGVTFGGFNVCDISRIYEDTKIPVLSVTRREPNIESMVAALEKHFADSDLRIGMLKKTEVETITTENGFSVYINRKGISLADAHLLLKNTILRGKIPEAIRVAHLIAGAIKRGESSGKT